MFKNFLFCVTIWILNNLQEILWQTITILWSFWSTAYLYLKLNKDFEFDIFCSNNIYFFVDLLYFQRAKSSNYKSLKLHRQGAFIREIIIYKRNYFSPSFSPLLLISRKSAQYKNNIISLTYWI